MDQNIKGFFWNGDFDSYFLGHQFEEIFKSRIYAPYLENVKDAVVLDIGGNIGLFSLYASKYAKQVYSLEPSLEHFDVFSRMVAFNQLHNVKPLRKALYIDNKDHHFFHNKNKTMFSLHQAVHDGSSQPETVQTISLDQLFEEEGIEHVNLMKLDIEGSEAEILGGEGFRKVAEKIDTIVLETHAWMGRHPNQVKEALKNAGFTSIEQIQNDAQLMVAKR